MADADEVTPDLLVHTTYRLHPDDADAFGAIATRMAEDARRRSGNVFLEVTQEVGDRAAFHLIEGWRSQQALDDHLASDGFQMVVADAQQLRLEQRSTTVFQVAARQEM